MKSSESYCVPWSLLSFNEVPLQTPLSRLLKTFFTAALTGSIAAHLVPRLHMCQAIISSLKWSITAKNQHQPMLSTKNFLPSVPHSRLGCSCIILPLCSFFFTSQVCLYGLRRLFSRISLFTRRLDTWICFFFASFFQTLM